MNTTIKKWFILAFLCWMPVFSQVVNNGYLLEKTTGIPNQISESPVPARVASSANGLAFLYLGASKEPKVSVKSPDGRFLEVRNVPTCLIRPFAQIPNAYTTGHYVVSSEGIYAGCQNTTDTKYNSVLRTGADWVSFTEVLKIGTEFSYSQAPTGFSGRGTLKEIVSGMWPGGYAFMSVTDNGKENLGIFQIGNTWQQAMPPQSNISPMIGSPIWSEDGVNIYFLSFQVENRGYVIMRWNSSSKTLTKELTESQVGANPSSLRLLLANDNKTLLAKYSVGSDETIVTIPSMEKVLSPSTFEGKYSQAGPIATSIGFSVKTSSTDRFYSSFATCEEKTCRNAIESKNLGEKTSVLYSWLEEGVLNFNTVNTDTLKATGWYKLLWPKIAKATQEQSKLVVEGSGYDLGKVEVRIRDRRLVPTSTTSTRLEITIPQDAYFYGENLPLQVFVLHQAGELKSWEKTVSLTAPRPTAKISFKPVDPEKTRVFPGDLVEITWETEATEVVFLNGEEKPAKGMMLMAMTASMDFEVVAYGPGGEAKDKVRVVVSLPPPVITEVLYSFNTEQEITQFKISGQNLASTTLQVKVELASGEVIQELQVSSASAELLEVYLPGILKPGKYIITVTRPPEEGSGDQEEKASSSVEIPEEEVASQATGSPKGGRN